MVISIRASLVAIGLSLAPLAAGAQQTVVITHLPPPAPLAEAQPPSPGPGHAWIGGFWNWNGTQYAWSAGHWERPPQPAQTWEQPRWEREDGRYRFRQGRWAGQGMGGPTQPQPQMQPMPHPMPMPPVIAQPALPSGPMQVPMGPPRPRFERRPRMAPQGQVWLPGHWAWDHSQYVWNAGHFEAPPQPQQQWVGPRVMRRGRNWQITPGRWR